MQAGALGEKNPICAAILHELGILYKKWQRNDLARENFERSLELREEVLGRSSEQAC